MKKLFLSLFSFLIVTGLSAQPEDKKIAKITFLMVDGKYEDAAFKASNLLENDDYKRNNWVFFYLAQSYYEIARKPELQEDYPKALKESLKMTYKLYKYREKTDENNKVYHESEEFRMVLKDSTITVSEIYYDNDNPRKAAYYLKTITKFDPDDYGVWLMKGVYEIKSRNVGEGVKSIMLAMDSLSMDYKPDEVSAQTLVDALEEYALIVQSGEYDKYFKAYKFEPTSKDVDEAMAMKNEFKQYIKGDVVDKDDRKKESEVIYKSFKSDETEDEDEE